MLTLANLEAALERVSRKNGNPGSDGVTIEAFSTRRNLVALVTEIEANAYRTLPAKTFKFPKPEGGFRTISVLCVRDRVVHCALAAAISTMAEEQLSDHTHAYRPRRSCRTAADVIRGANLEWLAVGDVAAYYDNIGHSALKRAIESVVNADFTDLTMACISPLSSVGIPQGSSLSPVLSNIYLDQFDRDMAAIGPYVRYSDNFAVACKSKGCAETALTEAGILLATRGLSLNGKSGAVQTRGSVFLGETL